MGGKAWMGVLAGLVCMVMVIGTVMASEGEGKGPMGKGQGRGGAGMQGHGKGPGHPGQGRRNGQHKFASEEMQKEFERFKKEMEDIRAEIQALREKIKNALKEAHKGEGKPDIEKMKEIVKQYEDEAKALATKLADARITHHKNIVTILESQKGEMVEKLTKMMLLPHPGRAKGIRKGAGGEGEGGEGKGGRGEMMRQRMKERRGGGGQGKPGADDDGDDINIEPASYDLKIEMM